MNIRVVNERDERGGFRAVRDEQGRVRVWHSGADRYGWADLFMTWDEVEAVPGNPAVDEWAAQPVTLGDLSDALAGAVDAIRQHVDDKMAPAAKRDDGPAPEDAPTQDEGVEPGPSGDDQSASPVPSAPRRPFAGMERQLADHRHQLEALRDHLGVIERTFTRYESFSDLRDRVDRHEARLAGGVAILSRIRTLESHAVGHGLRITQLEHDLREATQREEP